MTAPVLADTRHTSAQAVPSRPRRRVRTVVAAAVTVVVILAFWSVDITWSRLADLPAELVRYGWLMFSSPTWGKLPDALWQTWQSVQMAWVGTVLGVIVATPLSLVAARGFGPAWLRAILRFVFSTIRAVPEIIFAIIILSMTGLTPLTGALALAINGIGTLGKWGYEAVEAVPVGAVEAARAAGGSSAQVLRWGVWPQATPVFLSFWLYRFEINVRSSAVLGLIGVGGIGDMLTTYTQYREWSTVGMLLIVVIVVTMTIDGISGRIRRRIMEGARVR
ncbi:MULTISPECIES: phosphonate ABC transporter, permease protein PhnE [Microbacterium]|uniref:phosphonate ABC transporter, permease protein PhnE n=1 Tax=Microbacterium TaxID=33882 RepID=UPI000E710B61|nr:MULTISPECIES: phosphonate ABC transporter, permease protein PhnE [Microbacterium]MDF2579702.1 ABC-type phosphate/phosphonate transport system, permease component [Microbacterium sp.]RKE63875.1 phosphonate transport system permease protein [Microbacterium sp. AG238]WJM16499.1 phosphonate ABC transporter, permease protein PhnE [Microbacterium arborescens]